MLHLVNIARQFVLPVSPLAVTPLGEGFINDTYLVSTTTDLRYILQRKNRNIFKNVPAMMSNIEKVTAHIRRKALAWGQDPQRSTLFLYQTPEGKSYYVDEAGEFWACFLYIDNTQCYSQANAPSLARAGGVGIGQFQCQLADFDQTLEDILPGFHDIRFRYAQWDATLTEDRVGRCKGLAREIDWIAQRRQEMLTFKELVENKTIPLRVSHNDTKISNILFDSQGEVVCVIDLDTVLQSTVLYDFGDAIRSYTNTAAEDEAQVEKVGMHPEFFQAYTQGYLSQTHSFLNDQEIKWLAFAAKYITYEQVLRFLMDYIDGDRYYTIRYPEHNLVRARAQYALLQSMEGAFAQMQDTVSKNFITLQSF
jgi:Putative homoserine kinase type II (protein kinase fold)